MAETKEKIDKHLMYYYLGCIVLSVAANTAHPVTPTLFNMYGLGSYMFGVSMAAQMLTNFLFSPFWGWLSSYVSSRKILLITCIGYAGGQALFGLSSTEVGFAMARGLAGIACGGAFVCILTYIVNTAPDPVTRGKQLTANATIQSVFGAFGYFIGGMLGEIFTYLAIIVQVVLLILSGFIFYFGCKDDARYTVGELKKTKGFVEFNPFHSFRLAKNFLTPIFMVLFVAAMLQELGYNCFDQTFNYYICDQFNFSSGYNGVLKAVMGLTTLIANGTICIWLIKNTNNRTSVLLVLAICSASMFGVVWFEEVVPFVIAFIIFYAFNSISVPLIHNLVASGGPEEQNSLIMGFCSSMKSLGGIVGALFAGILYTSNPKFPFIFGLAAFVVATVMAVIYKRAEKK